MKTVKNAPHLARLALARRYPDDYRKIVQAIKDGSPIDEVTVSEWAAQWLKLRERTVRPGTLGIDRSTLNKWIIPTIGHKPLAGLQRADIRAVHEAAENAGLSDSTVQRIHISMMRMLADALDEGHDIPQLTMRTRKAGGEGSSSRQALSPGDAKKILKVVLQRPDASRWVAAILQGMRPAEARGLRWSSVDLDRGLMTIEWQLKPLPYKIPRDRKSGFRVPRGFESIHIEGGQHLVRPKTKSGIRVVPLVPWLRTELAAWGAIAPKNSHDLVWTDRGKPIEAGAERQLWREIAEESDVWITLPDGSKRLPLLYEARHTAATLLMSSGADETTLTAIVGHSKIASTKAYLHTDETRKLTALNTVSEQLGITNN